jgi:hypothetical protein
MLFPTPNSQPTFTLTMTSILIPIVPYPRNQLCSDGYIRAFGTARGVRYNMLCSAVALFALKRLEMIPENTLF